MSLEPSLADATATFDASRRRLFGLAYRILGSAAEAEDVLQDAWLKWQAYERSSVTDARAFLSTIVARLAMNALQSARARRETYVGPWLPEPVDTSADPGLGVESAQALELAVLHLLEQLTPAERAAYVLREAFDYEYGQIAGILETGEANARQLVSRARKHLASEKRQTVAASEQRRLLTAFVAAARSGDAAQLEQLLAADVTSFSDGGSAVRAVRIPVSGRRRAAKFIASFAQRFWGGAEVEWLEVNGQAAVLVSRAGRPFAVVSVSTLGSGIERVFWLMNPEKLVRVTSRSAALS